MHLFRTTKVDSNYESQLEHRPQASKQQQETTISSYKNIINPSIPQPHEQAEANKTQPTDDKQSDLGYQLRALSNKSDISGTNFFQDTTQLADNKLNIPSLSTELINETLNYFVNCRHRLSQMTKTYDDSDAYILLLQEKEVDLELAARIGQDLLKQNKSLKESIKNLEEELAKRQDDVQQLRHELASKISLIDSFIEEEELRNRTLDQNEYLENRDENDDQYCSIAQIKSSTSGHKHQESSSSSLQKHNDHDDNGPSGFLSLTPHKPCSSAIDPFTSLPYHINSLTYLNDENYNNDSKQLSGKECTSTGQKEDCVSDTEQTVKNVDQSTQRLVESVTLQLVESNKRMCELQDELIFKGEQSLLQQEKIFRLEAQIRESDRRLDDIANENEALKKSIIESAESKLELCEELKVCRRDFGQLLSVFHEFQRETRVNRSLQHHMATYFGELDPIDDINNISFDSFADPAQLSGQRLHNNSQPRQRASSCTSPISTKQSETEHNHNLNADTSNRNSHSTIDKIKQQASPTSEHKNLANLNNGNEASRVIPRILSSSPSTSKPIGAPNQCLSDDVFHQSWIVASSSLHDELLESMQQKGDCSEQDDELEGGRQTAAEEGDDEAETLDDTQQKSVASVTGARNQPNRSPKHRRLQLQAAPMQHHQHRQNHVFSSSDMHSDSDGADSGMHTTNLSNSADTQYGLNTDTDSDDFLLGGKSLSASIDIISSSSRRGARDEPTTKKNWLGLSSFVITTLLLICLSATFNSSANSNLTHKLQQIRIDK